MQVVRLNAYSIEVFRDLPVKGGMHGARHPVDRLAGEFVNRDSYLVFQGMIGRDADAEVFLCNRSYPEVVVLNRSHAKSDVQLASQDAHGQADSCVRLQNDSRKLRWGNALPFEVRQHGTVDIQGVPDVERPLVLHRKIDRLIESALHMLNRPAQLADGEASFIRKFKSSAASAKKLNAPGDLERLELSPNAGMAGVETLSGPDEIALFGQNEGAH